MAGRNVAGHRGHRGASRRRATSALAEKRKREWMHGIGRLVRTHAKSPARTAGTFTSTRPRYRYVHGKGRKVCVSSRPRDAPVRTYPVPRRTIGHWRKCLHGSPCRQRMSPHSTMLDAQHQPCTGCRCCMERCNPPSPSHVGTMYRCIALASSFPFSFLSVVQ